MTVSKAKRAANNKWDSNNMHTIGCRIKKEEAVAFKEYAAAQGKTSNNLLKDYVLSCIKKGADNEKET